MRKLILSLFFVLVSANVFSQISVRYSGTKRAFYHHGDTIHIAVMLKLNPKSCLDGMKKTYIYYSGCEDLLKTEWRKSPTNIFQKNIIVKIGGNGNKAKITITRNTDKDSFFRQETFNIK